MQLAGVSSPMQQLPGAVPAWHAMVDPAEWLAAAAAVQAQGGRLLSLWGVDRRAADNRFEVCAAYACPEGLLWLALPLDALQPNYPDLSPVFPCANRLQRAAHDLMGIVADGALQAVGAGEDGR
jgi:Ni,Fe-hydrogenase III component G